MTEVVQKKRASIYANEKFICVQTCSGYRMAASDPDGKLFFLLPGSTTHELGQALQDALSVSRTLALEEAKQFLDFALIRQRYEVWVEGMMQKFEYSTRRKLFKNMKLCHVDSSEGTITIRPLLHEKLEAWRGQDIEHISIAELASIQEIGEGVRLALDRCL